MCPGNHDSAGKRKSGKTRKGNRWLRGALTQAAWAASHTKGTYLSGLFRRISARRGAKRAIVAVGHSILISAFYMWEHPVSRQRSTFAGRSNVFCLQTRQHLPDHL